MTHTMHNGLMRRIAAVVMAAALVPAFAACGASGGASSHDGPINVVASVNQWGTLAREIGGDDVKVTSIVDSVGVDAHDFEPKTSDMAKLEKADITVTNGIGYDSWATKNMEHASKDAVDISAAEAAGAKDGDNPHLWFSAEVRKQVAKALETAFAKQRPAKAEAFASRLETWNRAEEKLDARFKQIAAEHSDASYAATESVTYYLLKDMGLKDGTPEGYVRATASEGEPAPGDIKAFDSVLSERKVMLLINNEQEADATTKELVKQAKESGVPVVNVTEQKPEEERTLEDWISSLTDQVEKALHNDKD